MLQKNPKVKVEMVPDPENPALLVATYAYQAKYSTVRDRTSLLAQINRMLLGVPMCDLLDSYPTVACDLQALITAGDVVAVANTEDKDKILFPRGESFLVEIDGNITLPQQQQHKGPIGYNNNHNTMMDNIGGGSSCGNAKHQEIVLIETDVDPTSQIRRGEAIQVGGEWFRLSSAVRAGVPLSEQPSCAQAPLSVTSSQDLPKRNEVDGYIHSFDSQTLPLDNDLSPQGVANIKQAKETRERLAKVAHGGRISSGGGGGGSLGVLVGQALGSWAHSSNPTALAGVAASSSAASSSSSSSALSSAARRRHDNRNTLGSTNNSQGGAGAQPPTKEELIQAASDVALATYSHAWRHGCTKDIREMYMATSSLVPDNDIELKAVRTTARDLPVVCQSGEQLYGWTRAM